MRWKKRTIALWCAAFLAVGSIRVPARAEEASGQEALQRYEINLGAKLLHPAAAWSPADGLLVYFGTFGGVPVKYRVLPDSPGTQTPAEPSLLLDADSALMGLPFNVDPQNPESLTNVTNRWPDSVLRPYLELCLEGERTLAFSADEASAIAQTQLADSGGSYSDVATNGVMIGSFMDYESSDRLFLLSAREVAELYSSDEARIKQGNAGWWTRSSAVNEKFAGFVVSALLGDLMAALREMGAPMPAGAGVLGMVNVNTSYIGLSPAMNLKLSSVLLSSSTGLDKAQAIADGAVDAGGGSEWKLTLLDADKSVKITDGTCADTQADGTIQVPYTYTDTDSQNKVNQISVMITDKEYTADDARVLYYGALKSIENGSGTDASSGDTQSGTGTDASVSDTQSGTGTFTLPKDLPEGYKLYLVAECVTDGQHSDYASKPAEIRFHTWSDWSTVKEPTIQETGLRERTCSGCGQTEQETLPKIPEYPFLEQQSGTYTRGEDGSYRVRIDADIAKFVRVEIDGTVVDPSNYTLESGSTIITFLGKFMDTLAVGSHAMSAYFTDGIAVGTITVTEPETEAPTERLTEEPTEEITEELTEEITEEPQETETETETETEVPKDAPKTGDGNNIMLWLYLLCISGTSVMLLARRRRKES